MDLAPKITGWALLVVGVLIIVWTLSTSFNIFTGNTESYQFFETPKLEQASPAGQGLEDQFGQIIGEQIKSILPSDSLPQILNLSVWSMLAFILLFGGSQIAGIGIKLIKK